MSGIQTTKETLDDQLNRVSHQLEDKYKDRAAATEIAAAVREEAAHFEGAKIKQYVPVLVQHAVQERFRHRAPGGFATA
jgi:hypothetical protein